MPLPYSVDIERGRNPDHNPILTADKWTPLRLEPQLGVMAQAMS